MKHYITFHGAPTRHELGDPPKFDRFVVARGTFEYTPQPLPPPHSATSTPTKMKTKTTTTTKQPFKNALVPFSNVATASNNPTTSSTSSASSASNVSNISNALDASVSDSTWWDTYDDGNTQLDPALLSWVEAREASLLLASERLSELHGGVVFNDEEVEDDYDLSIKDATEEDTEIYDWSESFGDDSELPSDFLIGMGQKSEILDESQHSFAQTNSLYSSFNETESFETNGGSRDSGSTVLHMPSFRIPVALVSSLKSLLDPPRRTGGTNFYAADNDTSAKVSLVVGVLDVDGPESIRIKRGKDAGKEVSLLKLIIGESAGTITKLTIWRELADEWGGMIRKGDAVYLEDVLFSKQPSEPRTGDVGGVAATGGGTFTASVNLKSKATICYRTIPWTQEDRRLRPDLRLAMIDPGVAKVADVVTWLERICGFPKST